MVVVDVHEVRRVHSKIKSACSYRWLDSNHPKCLCLVGAIRTVLWGFEVAYKLAITVISLSILYVSINSLVFSVFYYRLLLLYALIFSLKVFRKHGNLCF